MLEGISQMKDSIMNLLQDILDAIVGVIQAMFNLNDMLNEFDLKIQQMTDSCGASEFTGMPIVDAIGTFRYLVGDLAFYMIYFTVLIGCLLTIYKILVLLFDALSALWDNITGGSSKDFFSEIFDKNFY